MEMTCASGAESCGSTSTKGLMTVEAKSAKCIFLIYVYYK